jgi:hypothetical protein
MRKKIKTAYYLMVWLKNRVAIELEFSAIEKLHELIERANDRYWSTFWKLRRLL